MKIGVADYGMNVWYGGCYDLETRLLDLKKIGYDGIERLDQAVSAGDALTKAGIFRRNGMDFATCRGPNDALGIQWTAALGKEYVWLTVPAMQSKDREKCYRQAAAFAKACAAWNIKPVLHNHLGMVNIGETQEDVESLLDNCPEIYLLLDTGHLAGAGGDCFKIIEKYHKRIVSVHVKDYILNKPELGLDRWLEKGRFCELGAGNINLDTAAILQLLKKKGYDGWILVEHDNHLQDPLKDLEISRKYISKAGF